MADERKSVPRKHFITAFCVLGIVCLCWLFKEDVRGCHENSAPAAGISATKKIPRRVMDMLRAVATDYTPSEKAAGAPRGFM